jgi:hypothetical protein
MSGHGQVASEGGAVTVTERIPESDTLISLYSSDGK